MKKRSQMDKIEQYLDQTVSLREKLGYDPSEDGVDCSKDEPITEQHHKDDCDINIIMKRFAETGELPDHANRLQATFGDFSDIPDYQTSLNMVIAAREAFMELKPEIRKRFHNDPGQMIEFLQDERNNSEAVKLGLKNELPPLPKTGQKVSVSTITSSSESAAGKTAPKTVTDNA